MTRSRDVADTQDNLGGAVAPFVAGKNKIINGDFRIWQRGTSIVNPASRAFVADRFFSAFDGTAGTYTISQQFFTPGTAPVAGYEGTSFLRYQRTALGTGNSVLALDQPIEDVRVFAGQTATVSLWLKSDASRVVSVQMYQNFGLGGSPSGEVYTSAQSFSVTTSWQRYTATFDIPSISGKTIGTNNNSYLTLRIATPLVSSHTTDIWGVQLEAGSLASPFTPAGGGFLGAELALCQRYLPAFAAGSAGDFASGFCYSTTAALITIPFKVTPRVAPTGVTISAASDFAARNNAGGTLGATGVTFNNATTNAGTIALTGMSGTISGGSGTTGYVNSSGYVLFTGCEL
jgi:hypothetical protein